MTDEDIYRLLNRLGLTANYAGFFYLACAVRRAAENPRRLVRVTKRLYPEVAGYYQTTWQAVERSIRTVIDVAWKISPQTVSELARHPLSAKPSVSQFISILAYQFLLRDDMAVEAQAKTTELARK